MVVNYVINVMEEVFCMFSACTQNTDRECREEDCCLNKFCVCEYPDSDIAWGCDDEYCKRCGKFTEK